MPVVDKTLDCLNGIIKKYKAVDDHHAEVVVVVNPDGTPISAGGSGGGSGTSNTTEATQLLVRAAVETSASVVHAEDTPHTSGDAGTLMLAVRHDSDQPTADDGDYTTLKLDEAGRLKVATQPGSMAAVTGSIAAAGGTVAINVARASNVTITMAATALVGHNATFEYSNNSTDGVGGNWYAVQVARSNANTAETATGVLAATPVYGWEASVNGYKWFRVRAVAHTSGSADYILQPGTYATEPLPVVQVTGAQAVTLAALPVIVGQGAESAVAAGNAVRVGGRVRTAADTTLVANDAADHTITSAGQVLVRNGGLTESAWNANLSLTTTVATALVAAGGAGLKRHITGLQAINTGAAAVDLIVLDGATERWRMTLPINVPVGFSFAETHLIATAATALNANLSAAGTVRVCAQGYTAP